MRSFNDWLPNTPMAGGNAAADLPYAGGTKRHRGVPDPVVYESEGASHLETPADGHVLVYDAQGRSAEHWQWLLAMPHRAPAVFSSTKALLAQLRGGSSTIVVCSPTVQDAMAVVPRLAAHTRQKGGAVICAVNAGNSLQVREQLYRSGADAVVDTGGTGPRLDEVFGTIERVIRRTQTVGAMAGVEAVLPAFGQHSALYSPEGAPLAIGENTASLLAWIAGDRFDARTQSLSSFVPRSQRRKLQALFETADQLSPHGCLSTLIDLEHDSAVGSALHLRLRRLQLSCAPAFLIDFEYHDEASVNAVTFASPAIRQLTAQYRGRLDHVLSYLRRLRANEREDSTTAMSACDAPQVLLETQAVLAVLTALAEPTNARRTRLKVGDAVHEAVTLLDASGLRRLKHAAGSGDDAYLRLSKADLQAMLITTAHAMTQGTSPDSLARLSSRRDQQQVWIVAEAPAEPGTTPRGTTTTAGAPGRPSVGAGLELMCAAATIACRSGGLFMHDIGPHGGTTVQIGFPVVPQSPQA